MAPEQAQGRPVDARLRPLLARADDLRGARRLQPGPRSDAGGDGAAPGGRCTAARARAHRPAAGALPVDRPCAAASIRRGGGRSSSCAGRARPRWPGELPGAAARAGRSRRRTGPLAVPRQARAIGGLAAGVFAFAVLTSQPGLAEAQTRLWFAAAAAVAVGMLPRVGLARARRSRSSSGWASTARPGSAVLVALALAPGADARCARRPGCGAPRPWRRCSGLLGLALAFPALVARLRRGLAAERARRARRLVAGPRRGGLRPAAAVRRCRPAWMRRETWRNLPLEAIAHAVAPTATGAALALAAVWALAAAVAAVDHRGPHARCRERSGRSPGRRR